MKKLMIGNEAVARGLYEGGVRVIVNYSAEPYDTEAGPIPAHAYRIEKEGGENL